MYEQIYGINKPAAETSINRLEFSEKPSIAAPTEIETILRETK